MRKYEYSVNSPCNENWIKMTPNDNGKYCNKCCKTVVDFSRMNEKEIVNYLSLHQKEKTCGHFFTAQLENDLKGLKKFIINAYYKAVTSNDHSFKKGITIAILVIASFVTGCSRTIRKVGDVGGPVKVHNDTMNVKKDSTDRIKRQE